MSFETPNKKRTANPILTRNCLARGSLEAWRCSHGGLLGLTIPYSTETRVTVYTIQERAGRPPLVSTQPPQYEICVWCASCPPLRDRGYYSFLQAPSFSFDSSRHPIHTYATTDRTNFKGLHRTKELLNKHRSACPRMREQPIGICGLMFQFYRCMVRRATRPLLSSVSVFYHPGDWVPGLLSYSAADADVNDLITVTPRVRRTLASAPQIHARSSSYPI